MASTVSIPPLVRPLLGALLAASVLPVIAVANAAEPAAGTIPCDGSTYAMVQCLAEEGRKADAELAAYLAAAQARIDKTLDGKPVLAHAQAAWVEYRQAQCGDIFDFWREGSIRLPASGICYLRLTRQRTHRIWADYLTYPDSTPPLMPEPVLVPDD